MMVEFVGWFLEVVKPSGLSYYLFCALGKSVDFLLKLKILNNVSRTDFVFEFSEMSGVEKAYSAPTCIQLP